MCKTPVEAARTIRALRGEVNRLQKSGHRKCEAQALMVSELRRQRRYLLEELDRVRYPDIGSVEHALAVLRRKGGPGWSAYLTAIADDWRRQSLRAR